MQKYCAILICLANGLLLSGTASAQDDPKWIVAPYLWGPSISLDTSSSGGGGISAADLLDKTDAVGMLHMEWKPSRFGLLMDYMFLNLKDSELKQILPAPAPGHFVNAEVELTVFELGGFFRQEGDADNGFDWLFGARYISSDQLVLITPDTTNPLTQRFESHESFTDIYAGARVVWLMGESWPLTLRADVGGGDSEGHDQLRGHGELHVPDSLPHRCDPGLPLHQAEAARHLWRGYRGQRTDAFRPAARIRIRGSNFER